jgi:hypothetical protein
VCCMNSVKLWSVCMKVWMKHVLLH